MSTSSTTVAPDNTSAANFRAWGSAINAALAALGLVQTGDTGQINWTTVAAPGAGGANQGYEIWRFNDALQSSAPVYFKLEYGAATTTATRPGMWLQVGTGSNGTGTLTGNTSTRQQLQSISSNTTLSNCYFSGSNNRIQVAMWPTINNITIVFAIERLKDANGADITDGVQILMMDNTPTMKAQVLPQSGSVPAQDSPVCCGSSSLTTAIIGTEVGTFTVFPLRNKLYPPMMGFVGYMSTDLTALVTVTLTLYGSSHTLLPLNGPTTFLRGNSNGVPMMRYE